MLGKEMTFRESVNNLIRSDRPESPTELIFITGSLSLIGLQIYATLAKIPTIPHFESMLVALGTYKGVKVWGNKVVQNGIKQPGTTDQSTG